MGCAGCGIWDVGCLPGCGMLTYKMPIKVPPLKLGAYLILEVHNTLFKDPT